MIPVTVLGFFMARLQRIVFVQKEGKGEAKSVYDANVLTRREIMKILPEIKSKANFRNIIRRLNIDHADERRERHVITFLYEPNVVHMIKTEIALGDPRKRGWD